VQTAIGIKHPRIVQSAQGAMGGSFNTREFFHGAPLSRLRAVKWIFIALTFAAPIVLIAAATPRWQANLSAANLNKGD